MESGGDEVSRGNVIALFPDFRPRVFKSTCQQTSKFTDADARNAGAVQEVGRNALGQQPHIR